MPLFLLYCIILQESYYNKTFCSQCGPGDKYILPVSISSSMQAPINLIDNSPISAYQNPVSSSRYIVERVYKTSIA